jgi:lipoprotein-anchoring transpeptidase ErfK/SrfK
MYRKFLVAVVIVLLTPSLTILAAPAIHSDSDSDSQMTQPSRKASSYYVKISISERRLWLYQKNGTGEMEQIGEYAVGTAVRGLETYPQGIGKITRIEFNPWWHPTPYSRYVFKKRGIELPPKVPPGDPLNYMGPFKIWLSHKTWKGAIYRIHGNNDPKRVGRRVTGGCFVMNNDEGLELAHKLKVGTEVNIIP